MKKCKYDGKPCFDGVAPNDTRLRCGGMTCFYGADALRKALLEWQPHPNNTGEV